ncbi:MAG: hypothetical protein H7315_17895 [Herminiimonas sp.]|nr:hypothetical protein [Herminiimonas sp.]
MASQPTLPHQLFSNLLLRHPDDVVRITMQLWDSIATVLIPIIGQQGFAVVYARSAHRVQATYPWLAMDQALSRNDLPHAALKASLEARSLTEAHDASTALLVAFSDLLSLLIGEPLTSRFLLVACGGDCSDKIIKDVRS